MRPLYPVPPHSRQPAPSQKGVSAYALASRPETTSSSSSARVSRLQCSQIMRTRRCAWTQLRADTKL